MEIDDAELMKKDKRYRKRLIQRLYWKEKSQQIDPEQSAELE